MSWVRVPLVTPGNPRRHIACGDFLYLPACFGWPTLLVRHGGEDSEQRIARILRIFIKLLSQASPIRSIREIRCCKMPRRFGRNCKPSVWGRGLCGSRRRVAHIVNARSQCCRTRNPPEQKVAIIRSIRVIRCCKMPHLFGRICNPTVGGRGVCNSDGVWCTL